MSEFFDRWGIVVLPGACLAAVFAALFVLTSDAGDRKTQAPAFRAGPLPLADVVEGARAAAEGVFLDRIARAAALSSEVAVLKRDIRRLERTIRALNLKLVASRLQTAGDQTVLARRTQQIAALGKRLGAAQQEIARLRREAVARQDEIAGLRKAVDALRKAVAAVRQAKEAPGGERNR